MRYDAAVRARDLAAGEGISRSAAARVVAQEESVTQQTVMRWVRQLPDAEPVEPLFPDFIAEKRLVVGNRLAGVIAGLIETMESDLANGERPAVRDVKDLAVAFGVITDKRRLEDGESTGRTEVVGAPARERIVARLDDLAERRAKRKAT